LAGLEPAQPPGDHQVQNQEQLALQRDDDALSEPPQADDLAALGRGDRRDRGPQQERIQQHDALQGATLDVRPQPRQVDGDVRKLRHRGKKGGRGREEEIRARAARAHPSGGKFRDEHAAMLCPVSPVILVREGNLAFHVR
jgi:hypothetical protein